MTSIAWWRFRPVPPEPRTSTRYAPERAAAKKTAEALAAEAKANPAKFADLARQRSQDPGSAAQGGDLGNTVG